jgi:hypothetical protein
MRRRAGERESGARNRRKKPAEKPDCEIGARAWPTQRLPDRRKTAMFAARSLDRSF